MKINIRYDNNGQISRCYMVSRLLLDTRYKPGDNLLHPPEQAYHAGRRQHFQRMVRNQKRCYADGNSSTEKSFDSFDTATTDGARSSESSRVEMTTTSFESSTTDSDSHCRRQKMIHNKDDSGYKSTEIPQEELMMNSASSNLLPSPTELPLIRSRTASKKRRDFQSRNSGVDSLTVNRPNVVTSCSSIELDTTDHNNASEGSYDERVVSKGSRYKVFHRIFNTKFTRRRQAGRDYSVDEKTDAIFREFSRHDPNLETPTSHGHSRSNSSPAISFDMSRTHESLGDFPIPEDWRDSIDEANDAMLPPTMMGGSLRLSNTAEVIQTQQITSF